MENEEIITPDSPIGPEEAQEIRRAIVETVFMRALILGQGIGEISEDPTREETMAFMERYVGKIWDDYQDFKNSNDNTHYTEATIEQEEPSETSK